MLMCSVAEAQLRRWRQRSRSHTLRVNAKVDALHPHQLPDNLLTRLSGSVHGQVWAVSNASMREGCVHLLVELRRVGGAACGEEDEESRREAAHALRAWIATNLLADPSSGGGFEGVLHLKCVRVHACACVLACASVLACACVCVCVCVCVCMHVLACACVLACVLLCYACGGFVVGCGAIAPATLPRLSAMPFPCPIRMESIGVGSRHVHPLLPVRPLLAVCLPRRPHSTTRTRSKPLRVGVRCSSLHESCVGACPRCLLDLQSDGLRRK
jgi:hypothetical protein